jgi:hypothetical protein
LDTAGLRRDDVRRGGRGRARSLAAKTALLAVIFALVPVFLYWEFRSAYEDSQELLLRSVREEGRVIIIGRKEPDRRLSPVLHALNDDIQAFLISLYRPNKLTGGLQVVGCTPRRFPGKAVEGPGQAGIEDSLQLASQFLGLPFGLFHVEILNGPRVVLLLRCKQKTEDASVGRRPAQRVGRRSRRGGLGWSLHGRDQRVCRLGGGSALGGEP